MKTPAILILTLSFALGSLSAQTVPLIINYQGKITGSTGIPIGSTGTAPNFNPAPENRKIIFRMFDAQTGGTRLWSEQQTVTISLGEFSVLLGQGIDAVYDAATESRPGLDTVFTGGAAVAPAGPIRYLEIVVDDGNGTFTAGADVPITPRQRITTTAYSFRAKVADTVQAGAIDVDGLGAGAVTTAKILDGAVSTLKILDGSVTTSKILDSSITAAKIADGTIGTADLAPNSVTAAKLDPAIGIWSANAGNVSRLTGSVGIGKPPAVALDVAGAIAATGNLTAGGSITAAGAVTASSITTTGPFAATTVTASAGAVRARGGSPAAGNGFSFSGNGGDADGGIGSSRDGQLEFYTNGTERVRIAVNGHIGIGTNNPEVPLDVVGSTTLTMTEQPYDGWNGSTDASGTIWTPSGVTDITRAFGIALYSTYAPQKFDLGGSALSRVTAPIGIRSDSWIASRMGFEAYSDRRIKRDRHASVTASDLTTIQQLQVTDYRMVDPADGGTAWRKGFIAQEVEKVIPGAVTRSVEFVPDIFSLATTVVFNPGTKTLAVTLSKDHDLKIGERVRLHVDGSRLDLDVSAVPSAREFVVEKCGHAPEKVFVYGKQVNDFRTVDYDRIFTTSVGALQELKKEKDAEVKALQEENAGLRDRLATLEANDKTRDAKLAAIETLLLSAGKPAARAVSLSAAQ